MENDLIHGEDQTTPRENTQKASEEIRIQVEELS
jgi:hypothetical protein